MTLPSFSPGSIVEVSFENSERKYCGVIIKELEEYQNIRRFLVVTDHPHYPKVVRELHELEITA